MSNAAKILVPLLVVAALAGGAYFALQSSAPDVAPTPSTPNTPTATATEPKQDQPQVPQAPVRAQSAPQDPQRTAATNGPDSSNPDAPQGVRGRVLLPSGAPAAGVQVWLLESASSNPVAVFLANQAGKVTPPLASVVTGEDGRFQLGLKKPGQAADLRLVSGEYPEVNRPGIKVAEGDWFDAGDVRLDIGIPLTGRVVDSGTKAPIANATVYVASTNQSHQMIATPGRERGIPLLTDAQGQFRCSNAPRLGNVNLIAEAPGYAHTQLLNKSLKAEGGNDFPIELEVGEPIRGVVVDPNGKPIPGAQIRAIGLSAKTPQQERVIAGADGVFEFPTLRRGPYELIATATTHSEKKRTNVMTGETDVMLVMTSRGMVRLKVLAAGSGAPVKAYSLGLKRYFENAPQSIANVPEFNDRRINPGDYEGEWAIVRGLPPGSFRFQVADPQHAKTLSEPFTIVEGGPVVEVEVRLSVGGTIAGTVINDRGEPVAGANVASDFNAGLAADTELFGIFGAMMPEKHTKQTTTTDAQGRFVLRRLAFADYMVRVAHPQYCEGKAINLKIAEEGQTVDAGVIQLALGTVVEGITTVGGVPTGQIKVSLSMPMTPELMKAAQQPNSDPQQQAAAARALFNANVLSDGEGRFRLQKRVPPGTYKVTAARHSTDSPFNALIDIRETERMVTIAPGQESISIDFNLTPR